MLSNLRVKIPLLASIFVVFADKENALFFSAKFFDLGKLKEEKLVCLLDFILLIRDTDL